MKVGHVIALDPTVAQTIAFARAAGVSRFTYNWALGEWGRIYQSGGKPKMNDIKRGFNAAKREKWPWMMESPRDANSQPFADLMSAFRAFFDSIAGRRKGPSVGYPTNRKKGFDDSFYVANDRLHFDQDGKHVVLPVIGRVRVMESLRFYGKILSARVSRTAGKWSLSVAVECEMRVPNVAKRDIIGVDLGIKTAVVTSAGDAIKAPKPLKQNLKALRLAQRELHRRTKGGENRNKSRVRVATLYARIANIRNDFLHKVTTRLARENQTVVIEDLNVAGMVKNRRLARAISDVGFGGFRRMLTYKGPKFGCDVIVTDRWFPSSKRCSACGAIKETLALGERVYRCDACGAVKDRDENAALNLETYPRLSGNVPKGKTLTDTESSTRRPKVRHASSVVEVGTES